MSDEEKREQFDMLFGLLSGTYHEISELSKKKPDSRLNEFKIKDIDRILHPIKVLLEGESSILFLDILGNEDTITYSDAVIILNHYNQAMNRYQQKYYPLFENMKI